VNPAISSEFVWLWLARCATMKATNKKWPGATIDAANVEATRARQQERES